MREFSEQALEQHPFSRVPLPAGWLRVSLSDMESEVSPGFASGAHTSDGTGVAHLRPMNVDRDGKTNLDVVKSVASTGGVELAPGDILFNNTNSPELVGKTAVIGRREEGFAYSNHMTRVRLPVGASPAYFAHQLHFLWTAGYMKYRCTNHVNQASISSKTLADTVPVLLPPSGEQTRIVDKLEELLSDLDAGVAELKAAQKKLAQYRQSLVKAAVEGRLTEAWRAQQGQPEETGAQLLARILHERRVRWEAQQIAKFKALGKTPPTHWQRKYFEPVVPEVSKLPTLPTSWCWATTELAGSVLLGRQRAPQYLTGRWPRRYLRVANIKDDRIDFSDVETMDFDESHFEKYRVSEGDILVSEGQSPELVGQSAIFRGYSEPLCFQKTLHRFRAAAGVALPEYAQLVFRSNVFTGVFRAIASITTNIAHLTLEKFEPARFPLPPMSEQIEIVATVEAQLALVATIEQDIEKSLKNAKAQRKNILHAAFSGQLVPQDPNDEPASVLLARIRAERAQQTAAKAPRGRRPRAKEAA